MANVTFGDHGQELSYFRRVWMQEDLDTHMVDLYLYGKDVMSSEMLMTFGFETLGDQHVESFLKGADQDNQNYYYVDMLNSQEVRLTGPQTTIVRGTRPLSDISFLNDDKNMAYVYSDVIEYSTVGDVNTPLLDVVPLTHQFSGRQVYEFKHPRYVPIRLSSFDRMRIMLRDRRGDPFDFVEEFVMLALHIRRGV